jgi:hypothetical protein
MNLLPIEEATKAGSFSTLSLSQLITQTSWVLLLNLKDHKDPARITTHLGVSCYLYKSLESLEGDEESTIKSWATRATNETRITLSQVTNHKWSLVLIVALEEIGRFECVLEWIASSCIECVWVECLDILNGGGWGCIYRHQPLYRRCSFSTNRGQSAPLVRTVHPCTSMTEITMVSSNDYKCI